MVCILLLFVTSRVPVPVPLPFTLIMTLCSALLPPLVPSGTPFGPLGLLPSLLLLARRFPRCAALLLVALPPVLLVSLEALESGHQHSDFLSECPIVYSLYLFIRWRR